MCRLTIVIPVYNEDDNIVKELQELEKHVMHEHIINIIYDFDEDTTVPIVESVKSNFKNKINLIKNKYGRGVLNAIKTGLETATTDYVVVTMADLSDPPEVINKMLEKAQINSADIVCASRYMRGGRQIGGPLIKGLMSRFAGLTLHYFAKVPTHDATNSFKLYKKSFVQEQTIESNGGFELGLELVVKAYLQNKIISEVPTIWTDRQAGKSNFKIMQWLPSYLKWYFKGYTKWFHG